MKPRNDKGRIGGPFVPLLKETTSTKAWLALSHGARSLYVVLKSRYSTNFKNNGKIYLSTRTAAEELGSHSHRDNVRRWFRELQHCGFIVMTNPGHLGVEGRGKAPHWRLTEIGYRTDPPTKDFLRWDGTAFTDQKKQNPGPPVWSSVDHPVGPVVDHPSGPPRRPTGPPVRSICADPGGPPVRSISSLTTWEGRAGSVVAAIGHNAGPPLDDLLDIPPFLRRQ